MAGELITTDGQIEYGGVLFGATTPYRWRQLDGWEDLTDVSTGNVDRPGAHGSWPGRSLAGERVVTWQARIKVPLEQFPDAVRNLRRATKVGDEQPLVIRTIGETLMAYGRITRRIIPQDLEYRVGSGSFSVQWTCADPLRYSVTERSESAYLSTGGGNGGGLAYPLTYPLDYGAGSDSSSTLTAVVDLDADTPPLLVITGPIWRPRVVNITTGVQLEFDITLGIGDVLTVDCRTGEVILNGQADRLYTRTALSAPPELFTLTADENQIALLAASWDVGNRLDVRWRDATL